MPTPNRRRGGRDRGGWRTRRGEKFCCSIFYFLTGARCSNRPENDHMTGDGDLFSFRTFRFHFIVIIIVSLVLRCCCAVLCFFVRTYSVTEEESNYPTWCTYGMRANVAGGTGRDAKRMWRPSCFLLKRSALYIHIDLLIYITLRACSVRTSLASQAPHLDTASFYYLPATDFFPFLFFVLLRACTQSTAPRVSPAPSRVFSGCRRVEEGVGRIAVDVLMARRRISIETRGRHERALSGLLVWGRINYVRVYNGRLYLLNKLPTVTIFAPKRSSQRELRSLSTDSVELADEGRGEPRASREAGDRAHCDREAGKLYPDRIGGEVDTRGAGGVRG